MWFRATTKTMRKLLALILLSVSARALPYTCTAGTSGGVTTVCNVSWSSNSSTVPGEDQRAYDLYYGTAKGVSSKTSPIIVAVHGGGLTGMLVNGMNEDYAIQMALDGYTVLLPRYTLNTIFTLRSAITAGSNVVIPTTAYPYTTTGGAGFTFCPTGVSPSWTLSIDGEVMNVTAISGPCSASGTITVSSVANSHASGAFGIIPSIQLPVALNDIASLLSFLGQCSAGGSAPGVGACSTYSIPGDPNQIILTGLSSGANLVLQFIGIGKCNLGSTCTYLNNSSGTPGYSEWSSTNWTVYDPGRVAVVVGSPAIESNLAYQRLTNWGQALASNYAPQISVQNCGCGALPACTSGWNAGYYTTSSTSATIPATFPTSVTLTVGAGLSWAAGNRARAVETADANMDYLEGTVTAYNSSTGSITISADMGDGNVTKSSWSVDNALQATCTTPSACYTSCAATGPYSWSLAGNTSPVMVHFQRGSADPSFTPEAELLSTQPNYTMTVFAQPSYTAGQSDHGADWTQQPSPITSAVGYGEFRALTGVNNCLGTGLSRCPVASAPARGGIF